MQVGKACPKPVADCFLIGALTFAMPISWVIAAAAALIYLKKVGLQKSGIVEPSES